MIMSANPDVNSLKVLKEASLWFIIAELIGAVGAFIGVGAIIVIVSFILILFFALPRLKSAFIGLQQTGKNVSNGITGANIIPWAYLLIFIGGLIDIIVILTFNFGLAFLGSALVGLGVLLELVAGVLIGLAIYNVGRFYNDDLMWISGILIMIPVVNFVGWLILYIEIDSVINRITGIAPQPPYQQPSYITPTQPMVYQTGLGQLTGDGKATLTLYSNAQVQLVSASIDNTSIYVSSDKISPQMLNVGTNNVIIQFPPLTSYGFIKQNTYTITITLSTGQAIKVITTFV